MFLPKADAQPITSDNLNCSVPITYSKGSGTTLCDTYGERESDFIIGNTGLAQYENAQALIDDQLTNTFNNITIRLSGGFIVDAPIYFYNCNIICDANSWIDVVNTNGPSDGLYCNNTRFFSCTKMWDGIYIFGNPTISFVNNCEIEDAGYALNFNNATTPNTKLNDVRFNRNYIGIMAEKPVNQGLWSFNLTDMARVTFECTSDLSDEELTYVPNNINISHAGIQLYRVFMTLGVSTQTISAVFDGISVGLRARRSTVRLRGGCNFRDMLQTGPNNTIQTSRGWGIVAYEFCSIDAGLGYPCRLVNNRIGGIYTEHTNLTVSNSQFVNNFRGVYSINNTTAQKVWLLNNSVVMGSGSVNAFFVDRSNAPTNAFRVIVRGNVITRTAETVYPWDLAPGEPLPDLPAFRLRCRHAGVKDKVNVFLNRFTDNGAQSEGYEGGEFGFDFIPGSVNGTAYGNNIWFFDNFVRYNQSDVNGFLRKSGMRLFNLGGSNGIQVLDNYFDGTATNPTDLSGITMVETENGLFCSNTVDNLTLGMDFHGTNDGTQLKTNTFKLCNFAGLSIQGGGLGPQIRYGNMWDIAYETYTQGVAAGVLPPEFAIFTPVETESTDPVIKPTNTVPAEWFKPIPGYTDHVCGDVVIETNLTGIDSALIQGKLDTFYTEPELWSLQLRLMDKLKAIPAILDFNSMADTFYQTQNLQPTGRFAAFNRMVVLSDEGNSVDFNNLLSAQNLIDSLSILIDEADSTIMTGTLSSGDLATLLASRSGWTTQVAVSQTAVDSSSSVILQNRHLRYATALSLNDSITTSTVYQSNVKVMNGVILRTIMSDSISTSDSALVVGIAAQNRETGGDAVLTAQLWFPYNCSNELEIEPRSWVAPKKNDSTNTSLVIFPVPATDQITVRYDGNLQGALCNMMDVSGKTLRQEIWTTDAESFTFDIAGLPNGLYFLSVNMPDGSLLSKPFQIQR